MDKLFIIMASTAAILHTSFAILTPAPVKEIVCIDPGHGGDDPGTQYEDITEASIVFDVAAKLDTLLKNQGFGTVITKKSEKENPTNSDRAKVCNEGHADALVSIHLNSNPDTTLKYTMGLYGTEDENKDKRLADFMTYTVSRQLNLPNGSTTDFDSNLMQKAKMPATLIEVTFLSSPEEFELFKKDKNQYDTEIAKSLETGIVGWFKDNH